jgi:putative Holliday junction resolvase
MVDERLTSREAKSIGRQQGYQDLTKIDHVAASLIVQSWLDSPSIGSPP